MTVTNKQSSTTSLTPKTTSGIIPAKLKKYTSSPYLHVAAKTISRARKSVKENASCLERKGTVLYHNGRISIVEFIGIRRLLSDYEHENSWFKEQLCCQNYSKKPTSRFCSDVTLKLVWLLTLSSLPSFASKLNPNLTTIRALSLSQTALDVSLRVKSNLNQWPTCWEEIC